MQQLPVALGACACVAGLCKIAGLLPGRPAGMGPYAQEPPG